MTLRQHSVTNRKDTLIAAGAGLLALALRLPGLAVFLTADEPKSWFGRSIQFLLALAHADWAATFDSPAPGVTTMWAGAIGLLLDYARRGFPGPLTEFLAATPFDPLDPTILPLIRLPGVLWAVVAAILTYWWGRRVWGQWPALLAASFFALDPFLLALSRILGHDGLEATFMWLSLLAFMRAIKPAQPSGALFERRYLIISGLLGGLAFLTKYPSLFLGAFIALVMLILHLRRRQTWLQAGRAWLIDLLIWSVAAGLIGLVLWPAMWVDPVGRVLAIINDALRASSSPHQKGSFFLGQAVDDPGLSFYPIVTFFKTTVVLWLGWGLALWAWVRQREVSWRQTLLILLAYSLLYGLLVSLGGKKQDRYILPAFPALAAVAAMGYGWFIGQKLDRKLFQVGTIAALILIQAAFVAPHFPYYFTYYNPLLGGGNAAARMIIVGWGEGLDEAARWLNSQPGAETTNVVAWYSTTFEPFYVGHAIYKIDEEKISRSAKPGLAADYVIFYVNQLQRELPSAGALQHFLAVPPVHVVKLRRTDYAWIYPSVAMQHVITEEARLVGQAELLGYTLRDQNGNVADQLVSNDTRIVELYWEWQGKPPDEPIRLSLIDDKGQTWGWGTLINEEARLPFEAWQEGMVVRSDFALSVFPGTPPGEYRLSSWIDRPATGEVVGVFPFESTLPVSPAQQPVTSDDLSLSEVLDLPLTDSLELLGLSGDTDWSQQTWQADQTHDLILFWRFLSDNYQPDTISLALVDSTGQTIYTWTRTATENPAYAQSYRKDDVLRDPWSLQVPAYVPPGSYTFQVDHQHDSLVLAENIQVAGRPRTFEVPSVDLDLQADFSQKMKLLGLQATLDHQSLLASAGQPLPITWVWQAAGLMETDYTVTMQLLDGQNNLISQIDSQPLAGAAPTSSWTPGEIITDAYRFDVPAEVGPAPHKLLVAVYNANTGERLTLANQADHLDIPLTIR